MIDSNTTGENEQLHKEIARRAILIQERDNAHQQLRDQAALVKSYEDTIDSQETTDRILRSKIEELRGMVEASEGKAQALDNQLREYDWIIENYREKFDMMLERIKELSQGCEEDESPHKEPRKDTSP